MKARHARAHMRRRPSPVATSMLALLLVLLSAAGRRAEAPLASRVAQGVPAARGDTVPKATLLLGEKIFKGAAAHGICFTCHGANAKGIPGLGPDLTDTVWLHGDGSVAFIKALVKTGVPKAKKSPATMPPFGGSPMVEAQLEAVAQYVHSLSRK